LDAYHQLQGIYVFDIKCEGMTKRSTYRIIKDGKKTTVTRHPEKTKIRLNVDKKNM